MEGILNMHDVNNNPTRIGDILMASGRLTEAQMREILDVQKKLKLPFGEAAVKLNYATQSDIAQALSNQFDYPYLMEGDSQVHQDVIAAYQPHSPVVEALRSVRSQLVLRWLSAEGRHKSVAIYAEQPGYGCSWVTANLGVIFSQLGEKTLIIDANLRKPRQHTLFGLQNSVGLSSLLTRTYQSEAISGIPQLDKLHVLPSGPIPPNPQELLSKKTFTTLLNNLREQFDVVLIDTPSVSTADAKIILVQTGQAMIVCRKNQSVLASTLQQTQEFQDLGVDVLGSVLNSF